MRIKCGIEIDWLPDRLTEIRNVIRDNNFDCILGAIHILKGQQTVIYSDEKIKRFWKTMSDKALYERYVDYYTAMQNMAKNKICDVIAHIDLIKRDAYLPKKSIKKILLETIKIVAENNICVEINTSGLRNPIKEIHPSLDILKMCRKHDLPVTIGTDAHKLNQLDYGYDAGIALIKKAGYKQLATFDKRKRCLIDI